MVDAYAAIIQKVCASHCNVHYSQIPRVACSIDSMAKSFTKIKKRNGKTVLFSREKIVAAISRAGAVTGECSQTEAEKLSHQVVAKLIKVSPTHIPTVEEIQDTVENVLLRSRYKKTAKSYILYREQHEQLREITIAENNNLVDAYLSKSDWQVKESSNMSYSLQGLNNYLAGEMSKNYWLYKIYPKEIRLAQTAGDLHIHDLNLLSVYCVGWDLFDVLTEGFTGVQGKISSKPPKHFRSALGQVANFFYTLQGEAAGAQAFSNFDTLLAPFIRYDKLTYPEVKQALQEFLFNINVPTRFGFQTPFTNVTFDLHVPRYFATQAVMIGGQPQQETYQEFQQEMNLFNKAFLEVMAEGDANGRVFTFPIPTYNITKDFDWDNKLLDGLWQVTGKYGLPYFSNFIHSDMNPEDARSMCCRLRIDNRQLEKQGGGLFGANPLTGSIGVVTLNLPRIGREEKSTTAFLRRVDELLVLAKKSLEIKRKVLEQFTEQNLYPYTKFYLRNIKKRHGVYWKNHFSTIGIVGMNEALMNFVGENIVSAKGQAFTNMLLDHIREKLREFQIETGHNYNLEATPAESTAFRFALADQKKFPHMIFANGVGQNSARPFYTNSTHLPVNYTNDIFEALDLQDDFQSKYTGGTVIHLFLGEKIDNPESIKNLVRKICQQYRLPYFTLTPTFSVCVKHGYLSGEVKKCERCGEACEVYSRIVGYLRPVDQWNDGKQAEFLLRKTYQFDV
jgi:ribonucleoside-triphosphate reductase